MEIGVVGKPNVGKSTFFNASTLGGAEVASYPFTTVNPNRAVGAVKVKCICKELGVKCSPRNSKCIGGYRFVPVELIDVAGLVPDAHKGRGLGNKFLDELRQASILIHVVDASGSTDAEGNAVAPGSYSPLDDVRFLEHEIEQWFFDIFKRSWEKVSRKIQYESKDFVKYFGEMYSGLGFKDTDIARALKASGTDPESPGKWSKEDLFRFVQALRQISKPIIIAANKTDVATASKNIELMKKELGNVIPTSAMAEYVLRKLAESGAVEYIPGESGYRVIDQGKMSEKDRKALDIIQKNVFERFGNTGVQQCINTAIFDMLGKIVVYPVEDEVKLSDKNGSVLPDAFILDRGATPRELAFRIHTDIGNAFIGAIDARTRRKIGSDAALKSGDVIKILTR